jgi:hypothetical protein
LGLEWEIDSGLLLGLPWDFQWEIRKSWAIDLGLK